MCSNQFPLWYLFHLRYANRLSHHRSQRESLDQAALSNAQIYFSEFYFLDHIFFQMYRFGHFCSIFWTTAVVFISLNLENTLKLVLDLLNSTMNILLKKFHPLLRFYKNVYFWFINSIFSFFNMFRHRRSVDQPDNELLLISAVEASAMIRRGEVRYNSP